MYEALRAYFIQELPSFEAARLFGYTANSFRVLCHQFRRDHDPVFFASPKKGPHFQPKKSAARDLIVNLRKRNHSVYEILDEERPQRPRPTIEPIADARSFSLAPRSFTFVEFWKKTHGKLPPHLVFDSKLATYANLVRLDRMGITFITLRRRSPKLLLNVLQIPASAWRVVELDIPGRKFNMPRVYEQSVQVAGGTFRQLFIQDLGHDEPPILLTNDPSSLKHLITRYAQRMLIENALSDAVRFFHMNALSSAVGLNVEFHRRAHLPILLASDLFHKHVPIPWWNNLSLRLSTYTGR